MGVSTGWYDLDINLAIIKIYKFHPRPNVVDLDILIKVLALALMRLPDNDFRLCMYLLPEQFQTFESVQALASLVEKLEMCEFKEFWSILDKKPEVLAIVPGLDTAVRKTIFS